MLRLVEVQEQMLNEVRQLRADTEEGFRSVNSRLDQTNFRLDNLIQTSGGANRDLERRVDRLERTVFPPTRE